MKWILTLAFFIICGLTSTAHAQTVYTTPTGDKYHTADCRYSADASPVKLSKAKADKKTACEICKPNTTTGKKQKRCTGKTAEGNRCQRLTANSNGKCFQHQ
ncbi:MAG: hypothetical protein MUC73_03275 [Cyclobacteriaceae bacterium]|jgi:hypothetical protein|nr:hypothetical protein [Cyclobacteriaceae bacterium]